MQRTLFDEETDERIIGNIAKRMFNTAVQETSKMAFNELKDSGKQDTLEQEYIDQLWDIGEPSSDNEVNFHAGYYPDDKFGPRRRELEKKGYLMRCNKRSCSITKKFVLTFWFTDKGLELVGGSYIEIKKHKGDNECDVIIHKVKEG